MLDTEELFVVVVNAEEQYSIIRLDREVPEGWQPAGFEGGRDSCVDWVDRHWQDMRPRSLRQAMAG
jgi:MbtH protein